MSVVLDVGVVGVFVDERTQTGVVLLAEVPIGDRVLPIVVGPSAAQSIVVGTNTAEHVPTRPLAHDLVLAVVAACGGRVVRADVVGLVGGTYYGELAVATRDRTVRLDARPSDCIGVAVRAGVPIGVDRDVFDRGAVEIEAAEDEGDDRIEHIITDFRRFLDRAVPSDFGDPQDDRDGLD